MQHGALIILLAMMVIAVVAGAFVTQTMVSYRDRSLYFADDQINDLLGNYLDIEKVEGRSAGDKRVEYLYITARLREESEPLHFNKTLLQAVVNGQAGYYTYSNQVDCGVNPYMDSGPSSLSFLENADQYGVKYAIKIHGDNASEDFITEGDVVVVCAPLAGPLREAEEVRLTLVAEGAGETVLEFTSPDILAGELILLYEKLV